MRYGILIAVALIWALVGATCLPLVDLTARQDFGPETTLGISITQPSSDREVPKGAVVEIEWTAANLTGSEAIATILVRARSDFAETILAGGLRLEESPGARTLDWDTTDFEGGEYSIAARIAAGGLTNEASAAGRITINSPPSFEFTAPTEDTELPAEEEEAEEETTEDANAPTVEEEDTSAVNIRWTAFDPDGSATAQIGIDPDGDHQNGNETVIAERDLPTTSQPASLAWDGTNNNGDIVDPGIYNLYAIVSDGVNEDLIVDGLARITVPTRPEPIETAITEPSEDTDFLTTDDLLTIEYTLDENDDVLIDLEIDTDDNHRNGNEVAILLQRLIEAGTTDDLFDWDGTDSDGVDVDDGIYRILLVINRGTAGAAPIVASDALVFRRSEQEKPLIALLGPNTDQTIETGTDVVIRWRDDDPSESATIRLTIDDDDTPGGFVPDPTEREVLADRDASGDGVLDTFRLPYRELRDLEPGRYYVFAYIDRDGVDPVDHVSIAGGLLVIEDPENGGG